MITAGTIGAEALVGVGTTLGYGMVALDGVGTILGDGIDLAGAGALVGITGVGINALDGAMQAGAVALVGITGAGMDITVLIAEDITTIMHTTIAEEVITTIVLLVTP